MIVDQVFSRIQLSAYLSENYITKHCGGSIEREKVYVTYTALSLSVVIVLVLSRDRKRTFKRCGGHGLVSWYCVCMGRKHTVDRCDHQAF